MPADVQKSQPLRVTSSDGFLLGLESLMRRDGQGRHLAATVLECEGAPDLESISRMARDFGDRHPILQARVARGRDWIARWRVDEVVAAAIPVEIWHLPGASGNGTEIASLDELIDRCINGDDIDIFKPGPNLKLHVIVLSPDRWALVIAWSHSLLDAVGMTKLLQEFAGTAASPTGAIPEDEVSYSALYQEAHPMIEEMRSFPGWRVRSLKRKGGRPGKCRFHVVNFDREASAAIRAKMAETAGELLLLPYFASCAARAVRGVISARHPDEPASILLTLPVQRQKDPAKRPLFHNHMTAYMLLLTRDEMTDIRTASRALYRKYAGFIRRKLPAAMDALTRMMERCPSRLYNLPAFFYMKGEICSLFHSHTGSFLPGADHIFGSRVLNGYHVPSVCSPPGAGIFFSEHDGQLSMTLSWKDGCLSPLELELMKETLAEDLGVAVP